MANAPSLLQLLFLGSTIAATPDCVESRAPRPRLRAVGLALPDAAPPAFERAIVRLAAAQWAARTKRSPYQPTGRIPTYEKPGLQVRGIGVSEGREPFPGPSVLPASTNRTSRLAACTG
jgi:hypothetical protein